MPPHPAAPRQRLVTAVLGAAAVALAGHVALARSARSALDGGGGPLQQPTVVTFTPRPATPTPLPATPVARPDLAIGGLEVVVARHDVQTLALTATFAVTLTNIGAAPARAPISATWFADANGSGRFEPGADTVLASASWPADVPPFGAAALGASGSGPLPFRDAPILVHVRDSGDLGEGNAANNVRTTAGLCRRAAPSVTAGIATPRAKWRWPQPGTTPPAPTKRQVEASPAIVDLDGDGAAEIIFVTLDRDTDPDSGILRAVDGRTGADRFAVTSPEWRVGAYSAPAVGDLLGDGPPEIVAVDAAYEHVLAFDIDGTPLWRSEAELPNPDNSRLRLAGPSLADLDADGWPEILVDDILLDAAGLLLGRVPPGAMAVDLDLVGLSGDEGPPRPEIIGFGFALKTHLEDRWLEPLWQFEGAAKGVGFNAVANFDDDPYPEIVIVGDDGDVQLLHHNGAPLDRSRCFADTPIVCRQGRGGQGGPPVIADFDGDGRADFAVAGRKLFTARNTAGGVLWQLDTDDDNSGVTSATAFDFDGDGASEVVYADRSRLRLIDGRTGIPTWQTARPSLTTFEMPVVADVDGDAAADLVVGVGGTDANGNMSADAGLAVFDNPAWAPARPVWNQHAFAHTFVDDAGHIPLVAPPSWQLRNGFRDAGLPGAPPFGQPDLTVGRLVRDRTAAPGAPHVLARIGNAGSAAAGRGVEVAFHRTSVTGTLEATATLAAPLPAGSFLDVAVDWPPDADTVAVVVDPRGAVAECAGGWHAVGAAIDAEANNVHTARLSALPLAPPTPTPLPTPTRRATPTIGPTRSPTIELPWERTPSPTPTGRPSASPTVDGTPTATATGSPTIDGTQAVSPTWTATATPSAAPSSTPGVPSPTALRTPATLWLPVALLGRCGPGDIAVDAVLVIDTSAHMAERDGEVARLDLAKWKAAGVLGALSEGSDDRAAIVTAGDVAVLRAPFSRPADQRPLVDGLSAERATSPATPIDVALMLARAELGRARPTAAKLIVVISDGRAWPAQTASAAAEARAAEAAGAVVVALAVGDTAAPVLPPLVAIAGSRRRVRVRADTIDGEGGPAWAVEAARCPPGPLWAGR